MTKLTILALISALLLTIGCARKLRLNPAPVVPAAEATAKVSSDSNGNTKIQLKVEHLAKPESLRPPASAYVVWFQPLGEAAQNQGVLEVSDDLKGEFTGVTPYRVVDLFVTAEADRRAASPSGTRILQQQVSR